MNPRTTVSAVAIAVIVGLTTVSYILPSTIIKERALSKFGPHLNQERALSKSILETASEAPAVAWILSFPCTGSEYIIDIIHMLTHKTTASNYGNIIEDSNGVKIRDTYESEPVFVNRDNGPYIFRPDFPLPISTTETQFIPTLTHCAGTCIHCFPGRYKMLRDEFLKGCSSGIKFKPSNYNNGFNGYGWTTETYYWGALAKKALHVFRDPFDVVEERFLFYTNVYAGRMDFTARYNQNRDGMLAYCNEERVEKRDEESAWFNETYMELSMNVPCYSEFYKLIQWHNLVFESLDVMNDGEGVPVKALYYEDLVSDYENEANQMLDFFNLEPVVNVADAEDRPATQLIAHMHDWFTQDERDAAVKFMWSLANQGTRDALERYFVNDAYDSTLPILAV